MVAPLLPQAVHRARCRSTSLDASRPQRMTATAHASGASCWHRSQFSHSHGVARCRSPRVVVARGVFMGGIRRPPSEPSPAATHCGRLGNPHQRPHIAAKEFFEAEDHSL